MNAPAFGSFAWACAAIGRPSPCNHDRLRSKREFAKLTQLGIQRGIGGERDLALANCPDCKTTISRVIPLCEECDDTGGHDEKPPCWACAKGAAARYDGEWPHVSDYRRAAMGTRDEYVASEIACGCVDNRHVEEC
jgi:hypothetical protein